MKKVKDSRKRWKQLVTMLLVAALLVTGTPDIVGLASEGTQEQVTTAADQSEGTQAEAAQEEAISEETVEQQDTSAQQDTAANKIKTQIINKAVGEENTQLVDSVRAYDLSFILNGKSVDPSGSMQVTLANLGTKSGQNTLIYQVTDDGQ